VRQTAELAADSSFIRRPLLLCALHANFSNEREGERKRERKREREREG
jgi:hypothetical protein